MATKKKKKPRTLVTAEQRTIALARIEKLVEAGNKTGKSIEIVAKEFGVSESAVVNWRTEARKKPDAKAPKKSAPNTAKKTEKTSAKSSKKLSEAPVSASAEAFGVFLQSAIVPLLRTLVREEIRRAYMEGLGG